jgi:hypothetical protein
MSARIAAAVLFAVVYALVYLVAVEKNYALFTFHPATNAFGWGVEKAGEGPAMYWYGWLATAGIAATLAAGLGLLLPQALARRLAPALAWCVPLAVILFFSYLLRNFFLR